MPAGPRALSGKPDSKARRTRAGRQAAERTAYDGEERVVDTKSDNAFVSGNSAVCAAAGNVGGACGSGFLNAVFATGVALQDFCKGYCYTEGDAISYYQVGARRHTHPPFALAQVPSALSLPSYCLLSVS